MSAVALSDEQRVDWLRLIRSERIGPRTFRGLINQYGGARAALDALPEIGRRTGRPGLKVASRADAERELASLARIGGRLLAQGEPGYPRALLAVDTAPPLIAVRGSVELLSRPSVAIVGSRNASAAGGTFTGRVAAQLGQAGFSIVSGLARGIDTQAHVAALPTGTVAVLAGGHDRVYPRENEPLLERIVAEGGTVVSEMPLGWEPRGRDFPRRNRIVSGLSYGVVVVEAARRSGSLITARFALEQGREVFAVPGSPMDPRAAGTNDLIRSGATLCAGADDVLDVLRPVVARENAPVGAVVPGFDAGASLFGDTTQERLWDELDLFGDAPVAEVPAPAASSALAPPEPNERARILALLGTAPVAIDDLARQAATPVHVVQRALVELELSGLVTRQAGNAVSRTAAAE